MDYSFIWASTVNRILYILLFFPFNIPTVKQFPHKHIIKILITVLTNTAWQIIWYIPVLMPVIIDIIQTKYTVFQVRSIIKISSPSVGFKYCPFNGSTSFSSLQSSCSTIPVPDPLTFHYQYEKSRYFSDSAWLIVVNYL